MTAAQFDAETAERLERIQANPNPRSLRGRFASWAWGGKLYAEAARDSLRNVLACVGFATVIGDFATMRLWMAAPCAVLAFVVWRIDYARHF